MSLESESEMRQERIQDGAGAIKELIDLKLFIVKEIDKYSPLEKEALEGTQISYYAGLLNGLNSVLRKL